MNVSYILGNCNYITHLLCVLEEDLSHTKFLRTHYLFLLENIDIEFVPDHLLSSNVLSSEERVDIITLDTPLLQVQKMLSLITMKPAEDFDWFLEALQKSGQSHLSSRIRGEKELFTGKYQRLKIFTRKYNVFENMIIAK